MYWFPRSTLRDGESLWRARDGSLFVTGVLLLLLKRFASTARDGRIACYFACDLRVLCA